MPASDALVFFEQTDAIARITLNRPATLNAIDHELGFDRTPEEEAGMRRSGRINHYVAGPGRWTSTVRLMRSLPQPIVVRIQGYAYGAGFNLALGADFRVMARDAKLATPFVKRGLATGTNLLQQYVGIGKAIEMTMLGEPIDAD